MSSSVAWLSALTGLKVRLPQSLTQISERMSRETGALKPAAIMDLLSASIRGERWLSSSPSVKRLPSMTLTTPGSNNSAAGYTMPPMMRLTSMPALSAPSGSTLRNC